MLHHVDACDRVVRAEVGRGEVVEGLLDEFDPVDQTGLAARRNEIARLQVGGGG